MRVPKWSTRNGRWCDRAYSFDTSSSIRLLSTGTRLAHVTRSTTGSPTQPILRTISSGLSGPKQGTMLRYDNDHGDGTHHRHVGGDLDSEYEFPGSVATIYDRFFRETGIESFGPSPEDYDI